MKNAKRIQEERNKTRCNSLFNPSYYKGARIMGWVCETSTVWKGFKFIRQFRLYKAVVQ